MLDLMIVHPIWGFPWAPDSAQSCQAETERVHVFISCFKVSQETRQKDPWTIDNNVFHTMSFSTILQYATTRGATCQYLRHVFFLCITLLPPWISATLGRDLPWTLWTRCQWNLTFHNLNWKMSILTQVATHFYVKVSLGIAVWWCCLKIIFIFHSMGQHTGNVIKCPREWRTEPWKTWICCFVNNVLTTIHRSSSK